MCFCGQFCVGIYLCVCVVYLPAGLTKLLHIHGPAECDDEGAERFRWEAVITDNRIQHLERHLQAEKHADVSTAQVCLPCSKLSLQHVNNSSNKNRL